MKDYRLNSGKLIFQSLLYLPEIIGLLHTQPEAGTVAGQLT